MSEDSKEETSKTRNAVPPSPSSSSSLMSSGGAVPNFDGGGVVHPRTSSFSVSSCNQALGADAIIGDSKKSVVPMVVGGGKIRRFYRIDPNIVKSAAFKQPIARALHEAKQKMQQQKQQQQQQQQQLNSSGAFREETAQFESEVGDNIAGEVEIETQDSVTPSPKEDLIEKSISPSATVTATTTATASIAKTSRNPSPRPPKLSVPIITITKPPESPTEDKTFDQRSPSVRLEEVKQMLKLKLMMKQQQKVNESQEQQQGMNHNNEQQQHVPKSTSKLDSSATFSNSNPTKPQMTTINAYSLNSQELQVSRKLPVECLSANDGGESTSGKIIKLSTAAPQTVKDKQLERNLFVPATLSKSSNPTATKPASNSGVQSQKLLVVTNQKLPTLNNQSTTLVKDLKNTLPINFVLPSNTKAKISEGKIMSTPPVTSLLRTEQNSNTARIGDVITMPASTQLSSGKSITRLVYTSASVPTMLLPTRTTTTTTLTTTGATSTTTTITVLPTNSKRLLPVVSMSTGKISRNPSISVRPLTALSNPVQLSNPTLTASQPRLPTMLPVRLKTPQATTTSISPSKQYIIKRIGTSTSSQLAKLPTLKNSNMTTILDDIPMPPSSVAIGSTITLTPGVVTSREPPVSTKLCTISNEKLMTIRQQEQKLASISNPKKQYPELKSHMESYGRFLEEVRGERVSTAISLQNCKPAETVFTVAATTEKPLLSESLQNDSAMEALEDTHNSSDGSNIDINSNCSNDNYNDNKHPIVLENKILSADEKIDIANLLAKRKTNETDSEGTRSIAGSNEPDSEINNKSEKLNPLEKNNSEKLRRFVVNTMNLKDRRADLGNLAKLIASKANKSKQTEGEAFGLAESKQSEEIDSCIPSISKLSLPENILPKKTFEKMKKALEPCVLKPSNKVKILKFRRKTESQGEPTDAVKEENHPSSTNEGSTQEEKTSDNVAIENAEIKAVSSSKEKIDTKQSELVENISMDSKLSNSSSSNDTFTSGDASIVSNSPFDSTDDNAEDAVSFISKLFQQSKKKSEESKSEEKPVLESNESSLGIPSTSAAEATSNTKVLSENETTAYEKIIKNPNIKIRTKSSFKKDSDESRDETGNFVSPRIGEPTVISKRKDQKQTTQEENAKITLERVTGAETLQVLQNTTSNLTESLVVDTPAATITTVGHLELGTSLNQNMPENKHVIIENPLFIVSLSGNVDIPVYKDDNQQGEILSLDEWSLLPSVPSSVSNESDFKGDSNSAQTFEKTPPEESANDSALKPSISCEASKNPKELRQSDDIETNKKCKSLSSIPLKSILKNKSKNVSITNHLTDSEDIDLVMNKEDSPCSESMTAKPQPNNSEELTVIAEESEIIKPADSKGEASEETFSTQGKTVSDDKAKQNALLDSSATKSSQPRKRIKAVPSAVKPKLPKKSIKTQGSKVLTTDSATSEEIEEKILENAMDALLQHQDTGVNRKQDQINLSESGSSKRKPLDSTVERTKSVQELGNKSSLKQVDKEDAVAREGKSIQENTLSSPPLNKSESDKKTAADFLLDEENQSKSSFSSINASEDLPGFSEEYDDTNAMNNTKKETDDATPVINRIETTKTSTRVSSKTLSKPTVIPLKKRWDLMKQNSQEEIIITDDTFINSSDSEVSHMDDINERDGEISVSTNPPEPMDITTSNISSSSNAIEVISTETDSETASDNTKSLPQVKQADQKESKTKDKTIAGRLYEPSDPEPISTETREIVDQLYAPILLSNKTSLLGSELNSSGIPITSTPSSGSMMLPLGTTESVKEDFRSPNIGTRSKNRLNVLAREKRTVEASKDQSEIMNDSLPTVSEASNSSVIANEKLSAEAITNAPGKKRRGRPPRPKNDTTEDEVVRNIESATENLLRPRRRKEQREIDAAKLGDTTPLANDAETRLSSQPEQQEPSEPTPKTRGRKRKMNLVEVNESQPETPCKKQASDIEDNATKMSKGRGRKRKFEEIQTPRDCETEDSITVSENKNNVTILEKTSQSSPALSNPNAAFLTPNEVKKRGPRRLVNAASAQDFNPRLLLITERSQLDSDVKLTVEENPHSQGGQIQCGLCLERTSKKAWQRHLSQHYGIGWIVGIEEPIIVSSRSFVLSTIINYMKQTKNAPLNCRMCSNAYRSGLGILTHIENCGVEQTRVNCPICNNSYTKLSLVGHMRTCQFRIEAEKKQTQAEARTPEYIQEEYNNLGRVKRLSSVKAASSMRKLTTLLMHPSSLDEARKFIRFVDTAKEYNLSDLYDENFPANISAGNDAEKSAAQTVLEAADMPTTPSETAHRRRFLEIGYHCTLCVKKETLFRTEFLDECLQHIVNKHQSRLDGKKLDFEDSESDYSAKSEDQSSDDDMSSGVMSSDIETDDDSEAEGTAKKYRAKNHKSSKPPGSKKSVYPPRTVDPTKLANEKWAKFKSENYSKAALYTFALPEYKDFECDKETLEEILPCQKESMKFCMNKSKRLMEKIGESYSSSYTWSKLKRFDTLCKSQFDVLHFVGAAVKTLMWIPLPDAVREQYFIVNYRNKDALYTKFKKPDAQENLLLIYKLKGASRSSDTLALELHYAIRIPDGPVHCLSLMPSGGYDKQLNRLALLAVGTIHNYVKIYALPIQINGESNCKNPRILNIDAIMVLSLNANADFRSDHSVINTQCLQLCWSEFALHKHIFGSFSNGFVAIWKISDDDEMSVNRKLITGKRHFLPINYFYINEKCAKALAVHYDPEGPRWLAVAGYVRRLTIYDIKVLTRPVAIRTESLKNALQAIDWCPFSPTFLTTFGDAMENSGRNVLGINPCGVPYIRSRVDVAACGINQCHYGPLNNVFAYGTNNGDIVCLNLRELHLDHQVLWRVKHHPLSVASQMDIKDLNGQRIIQYTNLREELPDGFCYSIENAKDKYGLVFGSLMNHERENHNKLAIAPREPRIDLVPSMRVSAINCNNNACGRAYVACGFENGFIRLLKIDREKYFK